MASRAHEVTINSSNLIRYCNYYYYLANEIPPKVGWLALGARHVGVEYRRSDRLPTGQRAAAAPTRQPSERASTRLSDGFLGDGRQEI